MENAPPTPEDKAPVALEKTAKPAEPLSPFRQYLVDSKSLFNSIILIIPLFVIYQIGILTTGGVRNGVDFITDILRVGIFGGNTTYYVLFNLAVLAVLGGALFFMKKKQTFSPKLFGLVALEGTAYGLVLGGLIGSILVSIGIQPSLSILEALNTTSSQGPIDNFILSIGAGLYEELVFRLILLGGSVWFFTEVLKLPKVKTVIACVLVTSLIFSAIHYVGNMADTLELYSFMFRFIAGIIFAAIFYLRGFAVAVYTHAIYDVIVLVF